MLLNNLKVKKHIFVFLLAISVFKIIVSQVNEVKTGFTDTSMDPGQRIVNYLRAKSGLNKQELLRAIFILPLEQKLKNALLATIYLKIDK